MEFERHYDNMLRRPSFASTLTDDFEVPVPEGVTSLIRDVALNTPGAVVSQPMKRHLFLVWAKRVLTGVDFCLE